MCGYKMATNWQNFTDIYLAKVKILQKVLRVGVLFMTLTVYWTPYHSRRHL